MQYFRGCPKAMPHPRLTLEALRSTHYFDEADEPGGKSFRGPTESHESMSEHSVKKFELRMNISTNQVKDKTLNLGEENSL